MEQQFYNMMFNPQYVNVNYYHQIMHQMHYEAEQNKKVCDAVKAMHDLCKAIKELDQNHQVAAFDLCLAEMANEFRWK